ncbi:MULTISPECIES: hypothetical protein [unclassified Shinella]|uniref:hypothetical protein n=1 Tax=unclassified Shinella TaxID=2643062 RepID=UPI00225C82D7|nr:conserved hypothetical protein [Rhizobiaceae bacterium]CAK7259123.1 conserved protein of unknown function [Shinella sp. WSC3-e]
MTRPPSSIDEARAANPDCGFALYALEPGGAVTLEIMTPDGGLFAFHGASEADVLAIALPPDEPKPAAPTADIFD